MKLIKAERPILPSIEFILQLSEEELDRIIDMIGYSVSYYSKEYYKSLNNIYKEGKKNAKMA
jgi:hypothetical protein